MNEYYLHDGQAQKGPFTLEELRSENVKPDTLIWYEGITDWTKAYEVDSLKDLFRKGPPPLPVLPGQEAAETVTITGKKSFLPYIIAGILLVVLIIGYLMYQNSKHEVEIVTVQTALEQKTKEAEDEKLKQQQKENETKSAVEALEAKDMNFRNRWNRYITLTGSTYMTSGMGGISGLTVTVANATDYALDNVDAEVDYIKANGGLYKTEKVSFNIVAAGMKMTLPAPSSDRATSVHIRIQRIRASAFHFCFDMAYQIAGDNGSSTSSNGISGNPADPWKCN